MNLLPIGTPYVHSNLQNTISTQIEINKLKYIAARLDNLPPNLQLHPRVQKIIQDRAKMTAEELPIDWGYAEILAYATLLEAGYKVRLAGQDTGRGTFFHRHATLYDQNNGSKYIPLSQIGSAPDALQVVDSLLSEAAALGFEYGYSSTEPKALVIWEAQFGDFANGAQVIIDQFISSGEQKWGRLNGLTLLLPHGYEGQGPEHSSARVERYLQLCAKYNMQVCIPSTPAQMYHMLRHQMLRPLRKPLVIFTPKSLLRHKLAVSTLAELANGKFLPLLPDYMAPNNINRVILCSGKIYYELEEKRLAEKITQVAIIRLEQLYPFPDNAVKLELIKYEQVRNIIWCQEEPQNQGSWDSINQQIKACLSSNQCLQYAGREAAAAPCGRIRQFT